MRRILQYTLAAAVLCGTTTLTACEQRIVPKASYSSERTEKTEEASPETVVTSTVTDRATTSTAQTSSAADTETTAAAPVKKDPPDSLLLIGMPQVEVYEELSIADFITDTNAEILNPDVKLFTSDVGTSSARVEFRIDGEEYDDILLYEVVDTTPPVILNSGWEPYAKKGEPLDLNKIVGYADNFDREPVLTYDGEVNTGENGSYPISCTVTDSSGNSSSFDLTVVVLDTIPEPVDNNERVDFEDFAAAHKYDNIRYGIDVSQWQSYVDFEAVKNAGVDFVLMRMGYCYSEVKKDEYYDRNIEEAAKAGLDIGVYFYTADNTEEKIRDRARWIVEQLDGRELDFPIAFDWEEFGHFQKYGMSIHDLNELFEVFCDEVGKAGYSAMLYSSKNFLNNFWTNRNSRTVWLAHYVDETDYTGDYAIWQASAYGRIDGIDGDVDLNIQFLDQPLD